MWIFTALLPKGQIHKGPVLSPVWFGSWSLICDDWPELNSPLITTIWCSSQSTETSGLSFGLRVVVSVLLDFFWEDITSEGKHFHLLFVCVCVCGKRSCIFQVPLDDLKDETWETLRGQTQSAACPEAPVPGNSLNPQLIWNCLPVNLLTWFLSAPLPSHHQP